MPTPNEIIKTAASLMNDSIQSKYTNAAVLPFFNLALEELEENFELNDLPVTHKTSATITIPASTSFIGYGTTPALPANLIEIVQLWESDTGQNKWILVTKQRFLPAYMRDPSATYTQFQFYAWKDNQIEVFPSSAIIDLKIDYLGSLFTAATVATINVDIPLRNIKMFLELKTAAFCAVFLAENTERGMTLSGEADRALSREIGIPVKGMQNIMVRRRPFRANFKSRGRR